MHSSSSFGSDQIGKLNNNNNNNNNNDNNNTKTMMKPMKI